jgi:hypothetical protein
MKEKPKARTTDIAIRFPAHQKKFKEMFRKRAAAAGMDMNSMAILLIQGFLYGGVNPEIDALNELVDYLKNPTKPSASSE